MNEYIVPINMECTRETNKCPCTNADCPRHGKCCDCVAFHRDEKHNLPVCLRDIK